MPPEDTRESLLSLQQVGPATAEVLADAGVEAGDVESKAVSHAELVELGVNPGVAARIRREHSLQWSFEGGQDLDRRAEQVRGLQDDEREWVAASYGEEAASADGSGDATAEETAWRADPAPVDETASSSDADTAEEESAWRSKSWPNGHDTDASAADDERAWREQSTPTPVTVLDGIADGDAKLLARAGVTSVRSLATAHVEQVADSLGISADVVAAWKETAREHDE